MIFLSRNVKTLHQPMIVVAVGAWLCRLFFIGHMAIHPFRLQRYFKLSICSWVNPVACLIASRSILLSNIIFAIVKIRFYLKKPFALIDKMQF